jgi:pimeloyl-ACP methyl ester carboxylesterase
MNSKNPHRNMEEDLTLNFPGKMVDVNNHKMHVYSEGNGNIKLVFMAGAGTCSPMLDFKTLFSKFGNGYKIIVVEKAGYGYSEITDVSRDIDTILYETRTALSNAGIDPPYILFPHSMSGIEALYWVQKYPDEITAIVGLDPAMPVFYEDVKINIGAVKFGLSLVNSGFIKLLPGLYKTIPAIKYGSLTDNEKTEYKNLFYERAITNDMVNEAMMIKENSGKIQNESIAKIPMLFFISNGKGTGLSRKKWENIFKQYSGILDVQLIFLNASHYLHNIESERIALESKIFIENVLKTIKKRNCA